MKSKIKVAYVEAENLEELENLTNKEIEAIQVNIKNIIKDVDLTHKNNTGYVVQITYEEIEEPQILKESEDIN